MPASSRAVEIDFEAESRLDQTIQFPHPISQNALAPGSVFLTGATGFLGAYLLDELLRKTEATIHCLVRANDAGESSRRIVSHLQASGLWQKGFVSRIRAVAGDLERPLFGIGEDLFRDLAGRIDVIYHNGGRVNMAFPYERLKAVNVTGTQEVLRLAGLVCTKPVHFVSSIAVFFTDEHENGEVLRESDTPRYHPSLKGGYSKSKWVADRLVADAQTRGLPTCTYRPVRIMGHSRSGESSNVDDILPVLLKGCILLGKYPAFDVKITLVPVDYVSQAIVHLAGQEKSWGRAFHFFNRAPIEWSGLMAILRALGYPLQEVSFPQWWRELKQRAQNADDCSDNKSLFLKLTLALIAPHFLFYKRPPFDASYTQEGLAGTPIACPPIDHALIAAYVAWWRKSGYLPGADPGSMHRAGRTYACLP